MGWLEGVFPSSFGISYGFEGENFDFSAILFHFSVKENLGAIRPVKFSFRC